FRVAVLRRRPFVGAVLTRLFVEPSARCTRREIVRNPRSTPLLVDDLPARSVNFVTCRRISRFFLISSATIELSWATISPPPVGRRLVRVVFDPGGRPRRRGAFGGASSGAMSTPCARKKIGRSGISCVRFNLRDGFRRRRVLVAWRCFSILDVRVHLQV